MTQFLYTDSSCSSLAGVSVAGVINPLVAGLGSCSPYHLIETGGPNSSRTYIKFEGCSSAAPSIVDFQLFSDAGCVNALNASGSAPSGFCLSGSSVNGINSSKFVCSSAPSAPFPQMGVSVTITAYDDTSCMVRSRNFSGAPNPLATTWNSCTAGPTIFSQQHFMQALSCGVNASVALYGDSSCRRFITVLVQRNATCDSSDTLSGTAAVKFLCTTSAPPPPPPSSIPPISIRFSDMSSFSIVANVFPQDRTGTVSFQIDNLRVCNLPLNRSFFDVNAILRVGNVSPLEISSLATSQESCVASSSLPGAFSFVAQLVIPDLRNMSIISTDASVLILNLKTPEQSLTINQTVIVSARSLPIPGFFSVIEKGDFLEVSAAWTGLLAKSISIFYKASSSPQVSAFLIDFAIAGYSAPGFKPGFAFRCSNISRALIVPGST